MLLPIRQFFRTKCCKGFCYPQNKYTKIVILLQSVVDIQPLSLLAKTIDIIINKFKTM